MMHNYVRLVDSMTRQIECMYGGKLDTVKCGLVKVSKEYLDELNSRPNPIFPFEAVDDNIKELELLRDINKLMQEEALNSDLQWSKELLDKVKLHVELVNNKEE